MKRYTLKQNEDLARQRHQAFWENSSLGVPLVFAVADKPGHAPKPCQSQQPRKAWDLDPEWHLSMVEDYLQGSVFLADAMPVASLMVGLDITNTAVLAGADYDYSSTGDFVDFKPGCFSLEEPVPGFSPDHPLVAGLMRCYEKVIQRVGDKAMVNTPMTLDALSSMYGIRGSQPFLLDLVRRKKQVLKRAEEMTETYLDFYGYFHRFLKQAGHGESASWFQVFSEGPFESVRCDFSVMLSEAMFQEMVVPELTQVCDAMDHSLFNMCSVTQPFYRHPGIHTVPGRHLLEPGTLPGRRP